MNPRCFDFVAHRLTRLVFGATLALGLNDAPLASLPTRPHEARYEAARVALAKGSVDRAKRELKLLLQSNPLHADSHLMLASLLAQEGDLEQAIVGFRQALALEPNNAVARYNLGTALLWRGEVLAAARLLEEDVLARPDHVPSYNSLGKAYFLAGLPELAVASFREALQRDPENAVARTNLALLTGEAALPGRPVQGGAGDGRGSASAISSAPAVAAPLTAGVGPLNSLPVEGGVPIAAAGFPLSREQAEVEALQEILRDLRHVTAERRGGQLVLSGWTSDAKQRKILDKILIGRTNVLDLTTDDTGDPHRMIEVDATLFMVLGLDTESAGHNFLRRIEVQASLSDGALAGFEWLYSAALNYEVKIANVSEQRVAFLPRPHLTSLSGSPATFLAGGDIVFKVAGEISGDSKPYPFGTRLEVTPTVLRTPGEDGHPRVRLAITAGRKTVLPVSSPEAEAADGSVVFDNVTVTSEAILTLDQTLILTGLNQRERRVGRSGVPGLKSIPIIKYLFSSRITSTSDLAMIILLTPRDPAFRDEQDRQALEAFVEMRSAYTRAARGTPEDLRRFQERYPDWYKLAPNRFASHFFLMEVSEAYRKVSALDLADEALDFDLLGKPSKKKKEKR